MAQRPGRAEVRLVDDDGRSVVIGRVRQTDESWSWEHQHGEQSSPTASSQWIAAGALADYHRRYKAILRVSPQSCGAGATY